MKKYFKFIYSRLVYLIIGLSFSVVIIFVNAAVVSSPVPATGLTQLTTTRWNDVVQDLNTLDGSVTAIQSSLATTQSNITTMQSDILALSTGDSYINELGATVMDIKEMPRVIEIYNSDTVTYACQTFNVANYCGDYDGCTMRVTLQHEQDGYDRVHVIDEHIYMEQTSLSPNNNSGIYGTTRQSGGGDLNWITGIANRYSMFHPWDWVWAFNYVHDYCPGQVGHSPAHADPYDFTFMSHPHVRSRIVIYD